MKIAFIDLETTGLPAQISYNVYHPYCQTKFYDSSRIVQIACIICEIDEKNITTADTAEMHAGQNDIIKRGISYIPPEHKTRDNVMNDAAFSDKLKLYPFVKIIEKYDYIIKPVGFEIRNHAVHGITHAAASSAGIEFKTAIDNMQAHILTCDTLIAHNILFDKNILLSELSRINKQQIMQHILSMKSFCTSEECASITKIRYNQHKYKQPKLIELYMFLFGHIPDGLHNAIHDIENTAMCFFELLKRKLIKLCDIR